MERKKIFRIFQIASAAPPAASPLKGQPLRGWLIGFTAVSRFQDFSDYKVRRLPPQGKSKRIIPPALSLYKRQQRGIREKNMAETNKSWSYRKVESLKLKVESVKVRAAYAAEMKTKRKAFSRLPNKFYPYT